MLLQINGSQRFGGGHVWPYLLDSLKGNYGLANLVKPGCQGTLKSLPDYVIKVRVHDASFAITEAVDVVRNYPHIIVCYHLMISALYDVKGRPKEKPQREAGASLLGVAASTTGHLTKGEPTTR